MLGATIRLSDSDTDNTDGKQSMRMAIEVSNADMAKSCAIELTVGNSQKKIIVGTAYDGDSYSVDGTIMYKSHKNMYSKNEENKSVTYAVTLTNIPVSAHDTAVNIVGIAEDINADENGDNKKIETATTVKTVNGIVEALQKAYPSLGIYTDNGILKKNNGEVLTSNDINKAPSNNAYTVPLNGTTYNNSGNRPWWYDSNTTFNNDGSADVALSIGRGTSFYFNETHEPISVGDYSCIKISVSNICETYGDNVPRKLRIGLSAAENLGIDSESIGSESDSDIQSINYGAIYDEWHDVVLNEDGNAEFNIYLTSYDEDVNIYGIVIANPYNQEVEEKIKINSIKLVTPMFPEVTVDKYTDPEIDAPSVFDFSQDNIKTDISTEIKDVGVDLVYKSQWQAAHFFLPDTAKMHYSDYKTVAITYKTTIQYTEDVVEGNKKKDGDLLLSYAIYDKGKFYDYDDWDAGKHVDYGGKIVHSEEYNTIVFHAARCDGQVDMAGHSLTGLQIFNGINMSENNIENITINIKAIKFYDNFTSRSEAEADVKSDDNSVEIIKNGTFDDNIDSWEGDGEGTTRSYENGCMKVKQEWNMWSNTFQKVDSGVSIVSDSKIRFSCDVKYDDTISVPLHVQTEVTENQYEDDGIIYNTENQKAVAVLGKVNDENTQHVEDGTNKIYTLNENGNKVYTTERRDLSSTSAVFYAVIEYKNDNGESKSITKTIDIKPNSDDWYTMYFEEDVTENMNNIILRIHNEDVEYGKNEYGTTTTFYLDNVSLSYILASTSASDS